MTSRSDDPAMKFLELQSKADSALTGLHRAHGDLVAARVTGTTEQRVDAAEAAVLAYMRATQDIVTYVSAEMFRLDALSKEA